MRYMLLIYGDERAWANVSPEEREEGPRRQRQVHEVARREGLDAGGRPAGLDGPGNDGSSAGQETMTTGGRHRDEWTLTSVDDPAHVRKVPSTAWEPGHASGCNGM